MSVTVVIGKRHLLAGLSLVLLTALVGVALIVPAVSDATTTYTRSASCAGVNFYADSSDETYSTYGIDRYNTSGAAEGFRCNAALPNGAIVTKVQFTLDGSGSCFLTRVDLSTSGGFTHMAGPLTNVGGTARLTTTTITNATIDNASYAYSLECSVSGAEGIYGADVIYKITAAKG